MIQAVARKKKKNATERKKKNSTARRIDYTSISCGSWLIACDGSGRDMAIR
jgi:hypothetical protein